MKFIYTLLILTTLGCNTYKPGDVIQCTKPFELCKLIVVDSRFYENYDLTISCGLPEDKEPATAIVVDANLKDIITTCIKEN